MIQAPEAKGLFLQDRLEQVVTNPSAPHAWHRLVDVWNSLEYPARQHALVQLLSETPSAGVAGFLRATFLASVTGDIQYLTEAARIVREIAPLNVDRLGAFLKYAWWKFAIFGSHGRAEFLSRLRTAELPEVLSLMGRHLETQIPQRPMPRKVADVRKVAIVTPLLSTIEHAPTALAIHHAQLLVEQGLSVEIFAPQELQIPGLEQFVGGGEIFLANPPPDPNNWKQFSLGHFKFHIGINQVSLMTRYRDTLRLMINFDPDLVFFVGFFSPLLFPLFAARPVLGLSIHTVPPVGPVDVWLAADKAKMEFPDQSWTPYFPSPQAVHYPYRIKLRPEGRPFTRHELGLDSNAVVLISVGDGLVADITQEWANLMLAFLQKNRHVQWLLLGGAGKLPTSLVNRAPSQIRALAHHSGVQEICRCCDIFVNPPRMGGGFSVATAMAGGLPVVAYSGSDGGDKVATFAVPDHEAYFARLVNLMNDPALRKKQGTAMQALFHETLDLDSAAPALINACRQTLESYARRTEDSFTPSPS
jgi:glycosyltransferase involved in cell wall biosynthesis